MKDLFDIRKDFTLKTLDEKDVPQNPMELFETWYNEASQSGIAEPNAMNLATATADGRPSSRVVLLKQIKDNGFVFFTNYESRKGQQLEQNRHCALNFLWLELERQVRIEGIAEKVSSQESDAYFEMRPALSRLGAWASPQSRIIPNRNCLDKMLDGYETKFGEDEIPRPDNWGGYIVVPQLMEFWQGRANRLHDRIQYTLASGKWIVERLAP
ncbi:pyridoxamine 5'-phosphate oxidase [Dysgonomonas sp. 511]|uniref:pyridoxamine 5'-phosphate oxidase n=1 Tax=Dysgonomonas sp. 511 TaxID=2302930 RepID=UPI0013D2BC4A|nr:pyridoxamine 5'-phosphate oxidase [Dysgonomonas sp. 511]NDV78824.1 pyridoxamine 5'-phosphate oxidase [Dysgonomonas sp. 511]